MLTRRTFHSLFAAAFPAGLKAHGDLEKYYAMRNANDPDVSLEARRAVVQELRSTFDQFLVDAKGTDLFFLRDVFIRHSAITTPDGAELTIANAFQDVLFRDTHHVEVPAEFAEQTADFVEGLVDSARDQA